MQYSTVELRHLALEDVLAGPDQLHDDLPTRLGEVSALRKQFTDAQLEADREAFPEIRRKKPPRKGRDIVEIPGRVSQLLSAGLGSIRQLRPTRASSRGSSPRSRSGPWTPSGTGWRPTTPRSCRMNDGTSAALYQRDPQMFRDLAPAHHRDPRAAVPRVAAAGRAVPRRAARRHLAGDLGEDLPPLDRPATA